MRVIALVLAAVTALPLVACSSGGNHLNPPVPVTVQTATPVQQVFHTKVTAFGQLITDSRDALSLGLPQAGLVSATEARVGQRVQRGALLLKLQTDPATRSAYLQAHSAVALARDDLARTEHLHAEKLATNTQLDAARKALADAEAVLAAQAKLGGATAIAMLKAPANGVVAALDVQRGQRVAAGTRLIEFAPRAALVAQLGVEPSAAAGVHAGMPVTIRSVYAQNGLPARAGMVAMVGDAVNPATHLVDVIATFDKAVSLPVGTALSAAIGTTQFKAWAVPRNALQSDAHGSYVLQIEQGQARRVDVTVLAPTGTPIGVAGALDPHAPVITLGSYEVLDGAAVQAAPIAARRQRGVAGS